MKTLRDILNRVESKILPVNQVDHRYRLEHMTFTLEGISLQARLLTSNEQDYTIQGNYSYSEKKFTDYLMVDAFGTEFEVKGIVSKTLHYFGKRSSTQILESLGYDINE